MEEKDQYEYNKWVSHLNNTKDRTNYAIRRLDLLIISISGAGIYIVFETIRASKINKIEFDNNYLLLITGSAFLLTILINFASQITGYLANNLEEKFIQQELKRLEGKEWDEDKKNEIDKKIKKLNKSTDVLNIASVLSMLIGLLFLVIFNFSLF